MIDALLTLMRDCTCRDDFAHCMERAIRDSAGLWAELRNRDITCSVIETDLAADGHAGPRHVLARAIFVDDEPAAFGIQVRPRRGSSHASFCAREPDSVTWTVERERHSSVSGSRRSRRGRRHLNEVLRLLEAPAVRRRLMSERERVGAQRLRQIA